MQVQVESLWRYVSARKLRGIVSVCGAEGDGWGAPNQRLIDPAERRGETLAIIERPAMNESYTLHTDRNIQPTEFGQLAALNLWGEVADFTQERLAGHFAAVDFAAHVRTSQNLLVGYASAISNGLGAVFIDSLITHPEYDREAIGDLLLRAVLTYFSGQPVYAMPFVDEQQAFRASGFRVYRREMVALAHRNDAPSGWGSAAATEAVIRY